MQTIKPQDSGPAVEDVQERLVRAGFLEQEKISGVYDQATEAALVAFCKSVGIDYPNEVDEKVWSSLVDASFHLGDRPLYLRMPYFHGNDVRELQTALGALGFSCGQDGIFGAHTELALRLFQMNLGLPSDGIAGAYTFEAVRNLQHSWVGKEPLRAMQHLGFARAADVLERHTLCLYGTDEFTRSVASRMSNLALATNPASRIVSADALSVAPDSTMLLVQIGVASSVAERSSQSRKKQAGNAVPTVTYAGVEELTLRFAQAIDAAQAQAARPARIAVELPSDRWEDAGAVRSAQHYAITLLDALCAALS